MLKFLRTKERHYICDDDKRFPLLTEERTN